MKTLLLILISFFTLSLNAQIFKPLTVDLIAHKTKDVKVGETISPWLPRIAVSLTALAIDFTDKPILSHSLSSIGFGMSYGKYSIVNEKPYCNFSVNALLLTQIKIGDTENTKLGGALTIDVFNKLIGIGVGYVDKKALFLTMISFPL